MIIQITDATPVIYERGTVRGYDFAPDMEAAKQYAARLINENGKMYDILPYGEFHALATRETLARFALCEVTEKFYDAQLNVLPPMHRDGAMGFFVCERVSGSVTSQFVAHRGRYFAAYVDLADRATWITPDKIEALTTAAPLDWFPKGS